MCTWDFWILLNDASSSETFPVPALPCVAPSGACLSSHLTPSRPCDAELATATQCCNVRNGAFATPHVSSSEREGFETMRRYYAIACLVAASLTSTSVGPCSLLHRRIGRVIAILPFST